MHTNPPMYNPMMPNYPDNMGDPSQSNFNISYGAPNYAMPNYGTPNDGYPNYGSGNYMDHKPQMNRDRSQEFMPRKDYYPSKNPGHFQRDPQYNRNRPMGNGRNGMNNNGNNFQRMPNRKPRENSSYRSNPMDNSYDDPKVLQQSRKITKPMMMRNPGRRQDGPGQRPMNYGDRQPYNSNYSKPSPREPRQDFDDSEEQKANSAMFFKTKLCPHQAEGGCTRGNSCNYAHSESELRNPPNLKKTKLCQLFQAGRCNRGNMCSFAHGEQELRSTPEFYKTSICNGYLKGSCRLGTACRYAHGKEELRTKHENAPSYSSTNMMPHGSDPDNSNGYDLNSYQTTEPSSVDVNKDAKNNRFVVNGNNMHNYINHQMPMDSNPVDPTYLNNSQGNNGFKSSPSSRNDNLSQNAYNPVNPKYNNYVPNNWDRNGPSNKTSSSQVEHPDNINFHPYNPEKINFTPNENSNFLK